MCDECARKSEYEEEVDVDDGEKEDDTWRSYLDDDDAQDLGIPMDEADFEDEEEAEEEQEEFDEDEEWEEVSADDYDESLDEDDDDDDDDDF